MPIGGICGALYGDCNIEASYNLANINCKNIQENGNANITCGGIVGQTEKGEININKCFNSGKIIASGGNTKVIVGGILGNMMSTGNLKNCYNTGDIYGENEFDISIGGIIRKSIYKC